MHNLKLIRENINQYKKKFQDRYLKVDFDNLIALDKENRELIQIKNGLVLEDGLVNVDDLVFLNHDKSKLELKIHVGKNRIVRRIFKFLNYNVIELDRVSYSFLRKDNLKVGKWRKLKTKEVEMLKKQQYN